METKQVHRLFALSSSIKKLPKSRYEEAKKLSIEFLKDNNLSYKDDPIKHLHKTCSRYKIKALKTLVNERKDYYDLYKELWIKDNDITKYMGLHKLKHKIKRRR